MIMAKKQIPPPRILVVIDETWLREWIAYGFVELGEYLAKHAAFAEYLEQHQEAA